MKEYRKPTGQFIGATPKSKWLYEKEDRRNSAITAATRELARVLGFEKTGEFWTHALPEELLSILETFDNEAAEIAALAFLENRGYTVTKKGE